MISSSLAEEVSSFVQENYIQLILIMLSVPLIFGGVCLSCGLPYISTSADLPVTAGVAIIVGCMCGLTAVVVSAITTKRF